MAIQTSGINYPVPGRAPVDPTSGIVSAARLDAGPSVSSLHFEMQIRAEIGGATVEMISPAASCGSGCTLNGSEVEIVRFAKAGSGPVPSDILSAGSGAGAELQWLVTMQQGALMAGSLDAAVLGAGKPAELTLHGRMLLQHQIPGGEVVRLLSRTKPFFSGTVSEWPPRGARLSLTKAPIEYFAEDDVDRPNATPALRILSNTIAFGSDAVSLLSVRPEITRAQYLEADRRVWTTGKSVSGVSLSWTDTRAAVAPSDPPVRYYHVYRRFDGDDLNGWILARALPADITTWEDDTPDGSKAVEYIVLHAAQYPFGYRYECLIGLSVVLPRIVGN